MRPLISNHQSSMLLFETQWVQLANYIRTIHTLGETDLNEAICVSLLVTHCSSVDNSPDHFGLCVVFIGFIFFIFFGRWGGGMTKQYKHILPGHSWPYTKIWLRAMSTLSQVRARLSWSVALAVVPFSRAVSIARSISLDSSFSPIRNTVIWMTNNKLQSTHRQSIDNLKLKHAVFF